MLAILAGANLPWRDFRKIGHKAKHSAFKSIHSITNSPKTTAPHNVCLLHLNRFSDLQLVWQPNPWVNDNNKCADLSISNTYLIPRTAWSTWRLFKLPSKYISKAARSPVRSQSSLLGLFAQWIALPIRTWIEYRCTVQFLHCVRPLEDVYHWVSTKHSQRAISSCWSWRVYFWCRLLAAQYTHSLDPSKKWRRITTKISSRVSCTCPGRVDWRVVCLCQIISRAIFLLCRRYCSI